MARKNAVTFEAAFKEFGCLALVDDDPARTHTIADLVYITQFEIDLFNAGESTLTQRQIQPHIKFVKKWGVTACL